MDARFRSGRVELVGHVARPASVRGSTPGVIVLHGYPSGPAGAAGAMSGMVELADRLAADIDVVAMAPCLRGMGDSAGEFSIGGWREDIRSSVAHLRAATGVGAVWLVGFGTGGALAACVGADDDSIRGVAALAAPADFDDWARNPRRLHQHAREVGIVHGEPESGLLDTWAREMRLAKAVDAAGRLSPRPLLVVHGLDDDVVPPFDARVVADAHTRAELSLLDGAGHRLRHDPRAMAVLFGWLGRQRDAAVPRPS